MFALTMAVDPGKLLDETLAEKGMSHKEARILMGYSDDALFSRALVAQRPLDLHKAIQLPWHIFAAWWSKLVAAKASEFGDELRADRARMLKADVPSTRKEGAA